MHTLIAPHLRWSPVMVTTQHMSCSLQIDPTIPITHILPLREVGQSLSEHDQHVHDISAIILEHADGRRLQLYIVK